MTGVLVVGGTGMLAAAVRELAACGAPVFSVARRPDRPGDQPGVVPVRGDWARPAELAAALTAAGLVAAGRAVLWLHSPHRTSVMAAIAGLLAPDAVVVSLHGSAGRDPSATEPEPPPGYGPPRRFRTVVLGFADTPG